MEKFIINSVKSNSVNRNIRLDKRLHEKLCTVSCASGVSYNKVVSKCIEYALDNMTSKK